MTTRTKHPNPTRQEILLDTVGLLHVGKQQKRLAFANDPLLKEVVWSQQLGPTLFHQAGPALKDTLPEKAYTRLQREYYEALRAHMVWNKTVNDVLITFYAEDIPVLCLKGIVLANTVYAPGERTMDDVDLLIHPGDLKRAARALEETGFLPTRIPISAMTKGFQRTYTTATFKKKGFPWAVELHWKLFHPSAPFTVRDEDLWCSSQRIYGEGIALNAPPWEAFLLHLALHASYGHRFSPVRQVYDIARLIQVKGEELDWDEIRLLAKAWKCTNALALTLRICHALFGVPHTDDAKVQACMTPASNSLVRYTLRTYLGSPPRVAESDSMHLHTLFQHGVSWRAVGFLLNLLFPSPTILVHQYEYGKNRSQLPVAYLSHWMTLFRRSLKMLPGQESKSKTQGGRSEKWQHWLGAE